MLHCVGHEIKEILLPAQLFDLRGTEATGFSYLSFEMKQEQSSPALFSFQHNQLLFNSKGIMKQFL
jgi:hypothetical protein